MPTYFKPWRRKVGVVTLGLACVLAAVWVRSLAIEDSIYRYSVVGLPAFLEAQSTHGYIHWWSSSRTYFPANNSRIFWTFSRVQATRIEIHSDSKRANWLLQQIGIEIGSLVDSNGKSRDAWFIPYWSMVVPLTLLSAWLLLSRPRQKQPSKSDPR